MAFPNFLHSSASTSSFTSPNDTPSIIKLWLLRLLVPLGAHKEFIQRSGFNNDSLAELLGLGHWIDPEDEFDPKRVLKSLRKLYASAEKESIDYSISPCLQNNIQRLSGLVGLSEVDSRILMFTIMIHNDRIIDDTAEMLGNLSSAQSFHVLSVLLDIPEREVRSALSVDGVLTKTGLVSVDRRGSGPLRRKLDLLSDSFADHILSSEDDPVNFLKDMVAIASQGMLKMSDYEHIDDDLALLLPYLQQSIATSRKSVNIFIHGKPGTGKSELAKTLAKELDCELFEVASEDNDGDPVSGERRLRAFRAAQSFFATRKSIILFDEVEDVFNDGNDFFGKKSTAQTHKAWINKILEDNAVPSIWVSNSIYGIDPAFIRRFDMVFELPIPPRKQRERILRQACPDMLGDGVVTRIAHMEKLAPAVVTRVASVIRLISASLGEEGAEKAIERLICNTLKAQGHNPFIKADPNRLPEVYDPSFLNTEVDLAQIAAGLAQSKAGRICLYGPPGTGKTAYGRWLAEQLEIPLHIKRASDLMSKYVGESEQNIAMAFNEAEQEGALLLIDEVDSFLYDRREAGRSWEVSLVNEMLTQMESFSGVFVASTNLMDGLDQAALRRFDLKLKFGFLAAEQAKELYCRYCKQLGLEEPQSEDMSRIMRLDMLTPGDFAAVVRQGRFRPIPSAVALAAALEAECAIKEGSKKPMGFIQ